ncbi:MAG: response regulator transcription factor [Phycisphaeraceae bacterium]|nr:response regulator transcription factor [Phycisphaeraceae bacterium]
MATHNTSLPKARRKDIPPDNAHVVLVVEDEADMRHLLQYNLTREGLAVHCAATGEEALEQTQANEFDLILLDLMLPKIDGLEVCRHLRQNPKTVDVPIIMLTAKGEEADIITGLELGADDYVTKPFRMRELLARIRRQLRRRNNNGSSAEKESSSLLHRGALVIDLQRYEARCHKQPMPLSATEFRLLVMLATRPGRVFTRRQIIDTLHGGMAAVTDRSVDVQVVALRRKMGDQADLIETVRGIGYRFRDQDND